jgi:hypothetical protein
MMSRLPKLLKEKRALLAYEQVQLARRLSEVQAELRALDYTLTTLDADWEPPARVTKPARGTLLPRGAVATGALALLRQHPALWAGEVAQHLATQYSVTFADRRAELDFASAVAMALRRYERKGFVEVVERSDSTGELRWRLRRGANGRLALVPASPPAA